MKVMRDKLKQPGQGKNLVPGTKAHGAVGSVGRWVPYVRLGVEQNPRWYSRLYGLYIIYIIYYRYHIYIL